MFYPHELLLFLVTAAFTDVPPRRDPQPLQVHRAGQALPRCTPYLCRNPRTDSRQLLPRRPHPCMFQPLWLDSNPCRRVQGSRALVNCLMPFTITCPPRWPSFLWALLVCRCSCLTWLSSPTRGDPIVTLERCLPTPYASSPLLLPPSSPI